MFLSGFCVCVCLALLKIADANVEEAVAIVNSVDGKIRGIFKFAQESLDAPLSIEGVVEGLKPGNHGYHIHQYGNLTNGCLSTGPHFNPKASKHGAPNDRSRHAGDFGNIKVDAKGNGHLMIADFRTSLNGPNSIVGRAVVIHEKADDLGKGENEESRKTGNAGQRVACGIIAISKESAVAIPTALDTDASHSTAKVVVTKPSTTAPTTNSTEDSGTTSNGSL